MSRDWRFRRCLLLRARCHLVDIVSALFLSFCSRMQNSGTNSMLVLFVMHSLVCALSSHRLTLPILLAEHIQYCLAPNILYDSLHDLPVMGRPSS